MGSFWGESETKHHTEYRHALRSAMDLLSKGIAPTAALRRLQELQPSSPWTQYVKALHDARQGQSKAALDILQTLLQGASYPQHHGPSPEVLCADIALLHTYENAFSKALTFWKRALQYNRTYNTAQHRNVSAYLTNIAELLCAQGDFKQAIASYTKALQHDPDSHHALTGLIIALEENNQPLQARQYLMQLLINPNAQVHILNTSWINASHETLLQALLFESMGQPEKAREELRKLSPQAIATLRSFNRVSKRIQDTPPIHIVSHHLPSTFQAVAIDPQGRYVAFAGPYGQLSLTRLTPDATPLHIPLLSGPDITALTFNQDGSKLLVGRSDRSLRTFNITKTSVRLGPMTPSSPYFTLQPLSFFQGGTVMFSTSYSARSGDRNNRNVYVHTTPDPKTFAPQTPSYTQRFNLPHPWAGHVTDSPQRTLRVVHYQQPNALAYSPPKNITQAQGSKQRHSSVQFTRTAPLPFLHNSPPQAFAFDPSGHHLLILTQRQLWILEANNFTPKRVITLPQTHAQHPAHTMIFDPQGGAGFGAALLLFSSTRMHALKLNALLSAPSHTKKPSLISE